MHSLQSKKALEDRKIYRKEYSTHCFTIHEISKTTRRRDLKFGTFRGMYLKGINRVKLVSNNWERL